MRMKDDKKQEALLLATMKLVNEIGFAASSVAKIAKVAGVSPATLYVYFKNKEDLLVSTYVEIKLGMGGALVEGLDEEAPIYDILRRVWCNTFNYASRHQDEFRYAEQFANSPFIALVNMVEIEESFAPLLRVVERGMEQKVLKRVSHEVFAAFMFQPVMVLANPCRCKGFESSEANVEAAFKMAWDAVKL